MKANELMRCDFVAVFGATGKKIVVKVAEIYEKGIITIGGGAYLEDEITPIPLTPEILEKNGWKFNDLPFVQGWEQYGITIVDNRITLGQNVSVKVEFVHELQHVLRLCWIEKEITIE